ncbi:MAG: hypothetical protein IJF32_04050 [Oscillospiraceae bacterium]|nr:hypothetical protein [Oscillospiraceae bacterium]
MKNKIIKKGSIFLIGLTGSFVVLKLTGAIAWSWWLILLPVILPLSLALLILIPTIIALLVKYVELEAMHEINAKAREKSNTETIDDLAAEYGLERRPGESNLELKHRIAFIKQQNRRARHGMEE